VVSPLLIATMHVYFCKATVFSLQSQLPACW
jgi:hypothetical protein